MQNSPAVHRGRLRSRPMGGDQKRLHQGQAPGRPRECPEKLRPQAQALRAERSETALRPLTRGYPLSCRPGGEKGDFREVIEGHKRGQGGQALVPPSGWKPGALDEGYEERAHEPLQEVRAAKLEEYIRHVLMRGLGRLTRAELESWLDKAYATTVGKKWMDDRNRNLNKTSDPKDYPDMVKAMWDAHIYATNQASVAADI